MILPYRRPRTHLRLARLLVVGLPLDQNGVTVDVDIWCGACERTYRGPCPSSLREWLEQHLRWLCPATWDARLERAEQEIDLTARKM